MVDSVWKEENPCSVITVYMQLLIASFKAWILVPYLIISQTTSNKEGEAEWVFPTLHAKEFSYIARIPKGILGNEAPSAFLHTEQCQTFWKLHNVVTCLVSAFRIVSFHSPSEYVKLSSLYITNHGLNFKALDKNDLTLHL